MPARKTTEHQPRTRLAGICLLLALSACSTPDSGDAQAARECRTYETVGSKMKRSVCRSAQEWAVIDAEQRQREQSQDEFFRNTLEKSTLGPGPSFDSAGGP